MAAKVSSATASPTATAGRSFTFRSPSFFHFSCIVNMVVRPVRRPEGSARAHVDDGLKRGTARGDSATNAAAHSIAASSSTAITVKGGRMGE